MAPLPKYAHNIVTRAQKSECGPYLELAKQCGPDSGKSPAQLAAYAASKRADFEQVKKGGYGLAVYAVLWNSKCYEWKSRGSPGLASRRHSWRLAQPFSATSLSFRDALKEWIPLDLFLVIGVNMTHRNQLSAGRQLGSRAAGVKALS